MISKIKKFFLRQQEKLDRLWSMTRGCRDEVELLKKEVTRLSHVHESYYALLLKGQAEVLKKTTSIELEMLLQRDACLDNNFEGKQDL